MPQKCTLFSAFVRIDLRKSERYGESATGWCLPRYRIRSWAPVKRFKARNRPRAFPRLSRGTRYCISRRRFRSPLFRRGLLSQYIRRQTEIAWTPAPIAPVARHFPTRHAMRQPRDTRTTSSEQIEQNIGGKRYLYSTVKRNDDFSLPETRQTFRLAEETIDCRL